jgi:hypothetical protein
MELGIQPDYMKILKLDDGEVKRRLDFFELSEEDFQRLTGLKSFAERWTQEITEGLYELIMSQPESRSFFPDESTLARVKRMQNAYFLHLFSGTYDLNYVRDRLKVGAAHERIGMPPKLYLGAYRRYLALIHEKLVNHFQGNQAELMRSIETIRKIIFFDMALAFDTYIAAYLETMTRHQAAIRELSTPVIKGRYAACKPDHGDGPGSGRGAAGQGDHYRHRGCTRCGYEGCRSHPANDGSRPTARLTDNPYGHFCVCRANSHSTRCRIDACEYALEACGRYRTRLKHHWQENYLDETEDRFREGRVGSPWPADLFPF